MPPKLVAATDSFAWLFEVYTLLLDSLKRHTSWLVSVTQVNTTVPPGHTLSTDDVNETVV